jgi:hypothetical protein
MALASPFQTFSLCPGHQNPGILAPDSFGGTSNPVSFIDDTSVPRPIDTIFRINVPESKITPLLWNMKEWDVLVNFSLAIDFGALRCNFSGDLSGKFTYCNASPAPGGDVYSNTVYLRSTNNEPALKVDGIWDQASFIDGEQQYPVTEDPEDENYSFFLLPYYQDKFLLPEYDMNFNSAGGSGPNFSAEFSFVEVKDHEENPSGNCQGSGSATRRRIDGSSDTSGSPARCRLSINKLFLKGDGTVDVLCSLELGMFPSIYLVQNQIPPSFYSYTYEPVTFTFLGETVSAYIALPIIPGSPRHLYDTSLYDFNFSYDVTVQEEWTY